jgi:hypothetical protein
VENPNPYASPECVSDSSPPGNLTNGKADRAAPGGRLNPGYWLRFLGGLGLMAIVNVLPLYFTWNASATDGIECLGWPLTFHRRGGFSFTEEFLPWSLLRDVVIAVIVAHLLALGLQGGWYSFFRKLRTWGTPDDE